MNAATSTQHWMSCVATFTCMYARTIGKQSVTATLDLASLPPTSSASKPHSFRNFLQVIALNSWDFFLYALLKNLDPCLAQVQERLCNPLPPTKWGWKNVGGNLLLVLTTLPPAPEDLSQLFSCSCKKGCFSQCSCQSVLHCTLICATCQGTSRNNGPEIENEQEYIEWGAQVVKGLWDLFANSRNIGSGETFFHISQTTQRWNHDLQHEQQLERSSCVAVGSRRRRRFAQSAARASIEPDLPRRALLGLKFNISVAIGAILWSGQL